MQCVLTRFILAIGYYKVFRAKKKIKAAKGPTIITIFFVIHLIISP